MLFLFVFEDDFATNFTFRTIPVTLDSVHHDLGARDNFVAIWALHVCLGIVLAESHLLLAAEHG